ncbi:MAG TPA: lysine--tRNA ligase [Candidatus Dormibacteraeota bacterium]|nr:lysine--tRNA ligase [Candidatus Dormibacteraeota bacterium]
MEPDALDQIAARRSKLDALRAAGVNPYPNDFAPTHTTGEVARAHGERTAEQLAELGDPIAIAGRIVAKRDFGKASFLHLLDRDGRLQVHVKRDAIGDDAFATFKLADVGDVVGVVGTPFRTKTGELTLAAQTFLVLAKALRPLPEKWHGLTDVEARYRQRYVDLIANDDVRATFRRRTQIIQFLRAFFTARGYIEVETPMMQPIPGGAAAKPFVTHHNALDMDLFLRIAPELYLKRLLVGGFDRVFELNRVFRNEGVSTRHNPEFTLLEFYQAYATYEDLMALTEELFGALADAVAGTRRVPYLGHEIDLTPPFRRVSIPEFVAERCGLPLDAVRALDRDALRGAADAIGGPFRKSYDQQYGAASAPGYQLLDLFEYLAEPELVQPTFVYEYPVAVSPLARRNERAPAFVDRFELFIAGQEMANAFSELNDPDDQRGRLESQLAQKAAGDEEAHEMDEDFLRAIEHGMPPAAGEGVGIDRLVMLLTDSASIRDVILFPHMRPERR